MNWNQVEGQWKQMSASVKSRWAKIIDDDMRNLSAKKDKLIGVIQERYGVMKDEAEHQVDEWLSKLSAQTKAEKAENENHEKQPPKPL